MYISAEEEADLKLSLKLRDEGAIRTLGKPLEASDPIEFKSLIRSEVIKLKKFDQAKHGNFRLFNAVLVRKIKGKGIHSPYEKSRMVIAA